MKTISLKDLLTTSVVTSITVLSLPMGHSEEAPKQASTGRIVADSGFRPNPSGFAFENWGGDQYPYADLTANDAAVLFGDKVCARWSNETCVPTPATKAWLREMNEMMKGGHCEGMAALSAAFHIKQESPKDYGAAQPYQLNPKSDALMSTISAYFVTQALEPVQSSSASSREWPLQQIVDTTISTLSSGTDYPTLGIYGADGGHAITPYKVEQVGDGTYKIFVYDNNYPGAEKYVDVDTKKNQWNYAGAALNPKEDPAPWQGGAGDMDITLLSTRFEPLACPFCGSHKPPKSPSKPQAPSSHPRKPSVPTDSYTVITPNRCSQIQAIRKKDKKQLAFTKNGAKNEIAGARMAPLRGSRGCYVKLPAYEQYDVRLVDDGKPFASAMTDLFVFAAGNVYGVSNMALTPTTVQTFSLGTSGFSYQAGGTQKPTLIVATDTGRPNAYYEVSGFSISDGYQFNAESDESGAITFSDNDPNLDSFDVHGEIISETEDNDIDLVDLSAGDKGEVELEIENDGDVDVDIDSDADGTEDEQDLDDDNDGTPDAQDNDDDNDGTVDAQESSDQDHDGNPDTQDSDDDNDGTPDTAESSDPGQDSTSANESEENNDPSSDSPDINDNNGDSSGGSESDTSADDAGDPHDAGGDEPAQGDDESAEDSHDTGD